MKLFKKLILGLLCAVNISTAFGQITTQAPSHTIMGNGSAFTSTPQPLNAIPSGVDLSNGNITPTGGLFPRILNVLFADTSNVLSYGADPTGTTYSDAAFIAAASNTTRAGNLIGGIYVPTGKYLLQNPVTIKQGQCIWGDGDGASRIFVDSTFASTAAGIFILAGNPSKPVDIGPCIHDLGIYGTQPAQVLTTGTVTASASTITLASAAGVTSGYYIVDISNPAALPPFTKCTLSGSTCTLSADVTGSATGASDTLVLNPTRAQYLALGACDGVTTGCQYPPAITDAEATGRPRIWNVHMEAMWDCINTTGNIAVTMSHIECGALNIGWQTDGALDFQHVYEWHSWGWGFGTADVGAQNVGNPYGDGNTIAWQIGNSSVDAYGATFFSSKLVVLANELSPPITIHTLKLDSDNSNIEVYETSGTSTNGALHITGGYRTGSTFVNVTGTASAGSSGSLTDSSQSWTSSQWIGFVLHDVTQGFWAMITANTTTGLTVSNGTPATSDSYTIAKCPITVTGGYVELENFNLIDSGFLVTPGACVSGTGILKQMGGTDFGGTAAYPMFAQFGGYLDVQNTFDRFPATSLSKPMFLSYSGAVIITGNSNENATTGTIIDIVTDNASSMVGGNQFGAATNTYPGGTVVGIYATSCGPGNSTSNFTVKAGYVTTC